jgi:hypothetical protein
VQAAKQTPQGLRGLVQVIALRFTEEDLDRKPLSKWPMGGQIGSQPGF